MITIKAIIDEILIAQKDLGLSLKESLERNIKTTYVVIDQTSPKEDVILGIAPSIGINVLKNEKTLEGNLGGKDYIADISPQKAFLIFKGITFEFKVSDLENLSWKEIRSSFEELGLSEKDIEGFAESLVSLDKLRMKIKNDSMTDRELKILRQKLYGLAYTINEHLI